MIYAPINRYTGSKDLDVLVRRSVARSMTACDGGICWFDSALGEVQRFEEP